MYGICHQGVEQFVKDRYGLEGWAQIKADAGIIGETELEAYYEDGLNTRIFQEVEKRYVVDYDKLLFEFGIYWVQYASSTNLRALLADTTDFIEMLDSLNDMHARLKIMMPKMRGPDFRVEEHSKSHLTLHYRSQREGLAPMVVGLVQELGRLFDREVEVTQTHYRDQDTGQHDIFEVYLRQAINAEFLKYEAAE